MLDRNKIYYFDYISFIDITLQKLLYTKQEHLNSI